MRIINEDGNDLRLKIPLTIDNRYWCDFRRNQ